MTAAYPHILLAVDLLPETEELIEKARHMAESQGAKVSLLHVIEQNPMTDHMYVDQQQLTVQINNEVGQKLSDMAGALLEADNQPIIEVGVPKHVIVDVADKLDCDLIIVGSHGRSGLRALLGSTCNAILHHAKRDVLVMYYG